MERPKDDQQENQTEYVARRQECMEKSINMHKNTFKLQVIDRNATMTSKQIMEDSRGDVVWLYNPKRKRGHCPKFQLP